MEEAVYSLGYAFEEVFEHKITKILAYFKYLELLDHPYLTENSRIDAMWDPLIKQYRAI